MKNKTIVHIDVDAFFASVEQLLLPRLRGKPVAVGSGCIASCSYEARRYGLSAGMQLGEAKRFCPKLAVRPGSYGIYRCFTKRIWELCAEVAPELETHLDDAYLNMAGTELIYKNPPIAIEQLRSRIEQETGLTVSAGLGPNRMIARLAGRMAKPNGLTVVKAHEVEEFIVNRPVRDIPGIGHVRASKLARFGIHTVQDARALTREEMTKLFGRVGDALYERLRGQDTRPVMDAEIPKTISRETTFHTESTDKSEITGMLYYLVERALKSVRELGLNARKVGVKIRYADFRSSNAMRKMKESSDLEGPIFNTAIHMFRQLHTRRVAIRLIGITVSGLALKGHEQLSLLEPVEEECKTGTSPELTDALDELRSRFGFSAITAGRSIDLMNKLKQNKDGYVLRTPCLTK